MDIYFHNTVTDIQKVRRLHAILKRCYASEPDGENRAVITAVMKQLEASLTEPGLGQFSSVDQEKLVASAKPAFSLSGMLGSLWHFITGPSHQEEKLGKQRREQLERAEHAESTAFEALAESAELIIKLEQAHRKIHALETALGRKPDNS